jgi:hypothetical protein
VLRSVIEDLRFLAVERRKMLRSRPVCNRETEGDLVERKATRSP